MAHLKLLAFILPPVFLAGANSWEWPPSHGRRTARAARPGLKPPGCVDGSITPAPHTPSIAARTGAWPGT
jgi:hypothetical protein